MPEKMGEWSDTFKNNCKSSHYIQCSVAISTTKSRLHQE